MGLWGKVKKAAKKIGQKVLPIVTQGAYQGGKGGGGSEANSEAGQRSEAAKRLTETSKQAGGAQIKYQTEEETTA